jgi:uncharacterized protein YciI
MATLRFTVAAVDHMAERLSWEDAWARKEVRRSRRSGRLLVAAGPLRDVDGHGMTVTRFPSLSAAEHAATREDRSVAGGLLAVRVRPWSVVMTVVPDAPTAAAALDG